jgi:hypothetical protein
VKRISSRYTFIVKKVFPVLWFGFLVIMLSIVVIGTGVTFLPGLLVPVLLAVFGFFLMKRLVWDLVDEVYDCGDFLLVRNRAKEDSVALSNIMNVNASLLLSPPRITLRLVNPGKFGKEIAFSPIRRLTLNPFAKDQVSEELMFRVDQARSKRPL